MLVCASKKMSVFLNKQYKEIGFRFSYIEFNRDQYAVYIDYDIMRHTNDYNAGSDKFRVIRLDYPAEYYALPLYITTNLLSKCYKDSDGSAGGFLDSLQDEIII